ncbi:MAG: MBL fold metallo-hydrolase [Ignavibacteriaceae bacterium]|nr:MBL fold metallo-hydrolase [Ignavibacteriaceae bacterium]
MIKLKRFVFNPFAENTFLLWDEETRETMIVDPGCSNRTEENELESFIFANKLLVKFLINTHCHIDHIIGCKFIADKYKPVYLIPKEDEPLLQNGKTQAAMFGIKLNEPPKPDDYLSEDKVLFLGSTSPKLLFTPGHTPGEYCLYFGEEKLCLTGDVLFQGSVGRTDLWGADTVALMNSIRTKLYTLPDDVVIYPGHGETSTIGDEKKSNPFVNG